MLRRLSELSGPAPEAVAAAVERLRAAVRAVAGVRDSSGETARQRADLLERALSYHRRHPDELACPVCGSADRLDAVWAEQTVEQVALLREESRQAHEARRELDAAAQAARGLVENPPAWLPAELSAVWRKWAACRSLADPSDLALAVELNGIELAEACRKAREDAAAELAALDGGWFDAATRLAAWLSRADEAEAGRAELTDAKAARKWLRAAHDDLRDDRMRPLAEMSQLYWSLLRRQSSVALGSVQLAGATNQRRVVLDVAVDDIEAPALGVMSQGELHSLALSLFLPRAASPESPFKFLVIDDPVQSMDPAKVDGLAKVLDTIAETRQIVVFTHDTRLADSIRYQRLPATILEVTRKERSRVHVSTATDPVEQALHESGELVRDRGVTTEVISLVLPGLCRNALEAAFLEPVWRRLLRDGHEHAKINEKLGKARKLTALAALALYGDPCRAPEVLPYLRRTYGGWAAELVVDCNKGAHESVEIPDPEVFLRNTRRLAKEVRGL
ncbi:hypothetical protein HDA32_003981 [Spinactinospora alkalitolerans]|uniref:Nuclease SbcCD subunit C n=1 Tax=Spinactinospora alkalitolerans TaxID=687207 RepID=A0A852TYI7_9ACTN|nr:hypothetical protein [Spinactinospora alkalitolerans]NYE48861.1 hypothetical protein [Spinactinospora alkalitolerans]